MNFIQFLIERNLNVAKAYEPDVPAKSKTKSVKKSKTTSKQTSKDKKESKKEKPGVPVARYIQQESNIQSVLEAKGFNIWQGGAGISNAFPDIGASYPLTNDKSINLHIEVKTNKTDQMGSVRNWTFKNGTFDATDRTGSNVELILDLLNKDKNAIDNATKMLQELQKHFSEKVDMLAQSSLTAIKDKTERYQSLQSYLKNKTIDTMITRIRGPFIGKMIIDHYKQKFKPKGDYDVLMFVFGDEMFLVKTNNMPPDFVMKKLFEVLGVSNIPFIPSVLEGRLECRVQPRGLSKGGAAPVRLDTMANLRISAISAVKGAKLT